MPTRRGGVHDVARVHAEAAQLARAGAGDVVVGQNGYKGSVHAVVRAADRDVGLAAAERGFKGRRLKKAFKTGALQAQHDFTEGNDSCTHDGILPSEFVGKRSLLLYHFPRSRASIELLRSHTVRGGGGAFETDFSFDGGGAMPADFNRERGSAADRRARRRSAGSGNRARAV